MWYILFGLLFGMHKHALWYSADPSVTIGQLKTGDYVFSEELDVVDIQSWIDDHAVHAMVAGEDSYFYGFSLLPSAPYIVYALGDVSLLQRAKIAIVWPRAMTSYATEVLNHMFDYIPWYDVVTISGGADGVDMLCHRLSFEHNVPTIVVLGGGLRYLWRSGRQSFFQKVLDNGWLILSEFKLDMKPAYYTFPQRNRIVAWLADVVCVPEARKGSGSLITVDFAVDMKKAVYGAPNSLFAGWSEGLLSYLASQKVRVLADVDAMLKSHFSPLDADKQVEQLPADLSDLQMRIVRLCMDKEWTLDALSVETAEETSVLLEALTMLEMYGLVTQSSPSVYRCAQKIANGL